LTDEQSVDELVVAAAAGDAAAWNSIVDRFSSLVWSICMRCRLSRADAADVSQNVWLRLTEHLDTIREPAALPGWLATTTRRECLRTIRANKGEILSPMEIDIADDAERTDPGRSVLQAERQDALLAALAELPDHARALLLLLMEDPPRPYREISEQLGIPIGSIGPTRARHLQRLRQSPALAGFAPTTMGGDQR
jgi:RNA polymerase sigma factor (sigma-70 family)